MSSAGGDRSWAYTRPPGFLDHSGDVALARGWAEARLTEVYARYGYAPVEVPSLDYLELYHRDRVGDELFHHLLVARLSAGAEFPARRSSSAGTGWEPVRAELHHEVVLRPDLTAPLARHVVTECLRAGVPTHLPLRLSYAGSVFRDVDPRPQRLREFRQVGVELVGASGALADAEVVLCACDAAAALGLPGWTLHLGHAELYTSILADLGVPNAAVRTVATGLEQLARLHAHLSAPDERFRVYALGLAQDLAWRMRQAEVAVDPPFLAHASEVDSAALREQLPGAFAAWLRATWTRWHGVAEGVCDAVLRMAPAHEDVAETLEVLRGAATSPRSVSALASLEAMVATVQSARGVVVRLTPATTRGIAYYTGITFEIHVPSLRGASPDICGGGRYDTLHRWVHAQARLTREVRGESAGPALADDVLCGMGFAFGLERVTAALGECGRTFAPPRDVFVGVVKGGRLEDAFLVADRLRQRGVRVRSELRGDAGGQGTADQLGHAAASGARWALLVGGDEWTRGEVVVRDLDARTQRSLPLALALAEVGEGA